jgi:hypothetical protein
MPPRKDWTKITYIRSKHLPTLLHTWPPWAVVCPLTFEVVDAAVARHLPEPSIDVVITRIVHTPASVCYVLAHDRHGDQGKLWVRAVGPAQTELVVEAPPYPPRRAWTDEEEAFVRAQRKNSANTAQPTTQSGAKLRSRSPDGVQFAWRCDGSNCPLQQKEQPRRLGRG